MIWPQIICYTTKCGRNSWEGVKVKWLICYQQSVWPLIYGTGSKQWKRYVHELTYMCIHGVAHSTYIYLKRIKEIWIFLFGNKPIYIKLKLVQETLTLTFRWPWLWSLKTNVIKWIGEERHEAAALISSNSVVQGGWKLQCILILCLLLGIKIQTESRGLSWLNH